MAEPVKALDARGAYDFRKRAVDILLGGFLCLVSLPLWLVVASLIATWMGRPVLFRQTRSGRGGRPFELVKFRTMRPAPKGVSLPDGARITPLGAFLRRWSIDELPELWNVLRGDMSLVGPRPLLPEYTERYSPQQARRLEVRPGITGLAQVTGRNALSWEEKFRLDVWDVHHRSFGVDLKVLAKTLWHVMSGRGVNAPGYDTMPEFGGVDHE